MALKKIAIQGGVVKDDTIYSSEGKWIDSDKIRFYNGRAQKIGGWEKLTPSAFVGAARSIHSWRDFNDNRLVAIGTHSNIYILKDGVLYDITPLLGSFTPLVTNLNVAGSNRDRIWHPFDQNSGDAMYEGDYYLDEFAYTIPAMSHYTEDSNNTGFVINKNQRAFSGGSYSTNYLMTVADHDGPDVETAFASSDVNKEIVRVVSRNHGVSAGDINNYFNLSNFKFGTQTINQSLKLIGIPDQDFLDFEAPSNLHSTMETSRTYQTIIGATATNVTLEGLEYTKNNYSGSVPNDFNLTIPASRTGGFYRTKIGRAIHGFWALRPNVEFFTSWSAFNPGAGAFGYNKSTFTGSDTSTGNSTYTAGADNIHYIGSGRNTFTPDSAMDGIDPQAFYYQKVGKITTDGSTPQGASRRLVVINRAFEVPSSIANNDSYFESADTGVGGTAGKRELYGIVMGGKGSGGSIRFPTMTIKVIGSHYGASVTEWIKVKGVAPGSSGYSVTYSRNFFTFISGIYLARNRNDNSSGWGTGADGSNTWYWDITGSVSMGLSQECALVGVDYDNSNLDYNYAIPNTGYAYYFWSPGYVIGNPSANASTFPTIAQPMPAGEEHSNFAYGWGTNVWQANGWLGGSGTYSRAWGQPATTSSVVIDPRVYSFDNFGEDLVIAHNNGTPMYWDASSGVTSRAVNIDNTASPTTPQSGGTGTSPVTVKSIFVSSPDRHIVCLGAGNPMTVQWASQETTNVWTINDPTNTAGSQVLTGGTYLIGWAKVRGQTLIFSDNNVTGMVFQGPPYTFGFKELGNNCGLISPQGAITVQGRCYWMGFKNFFIFDGGVKVLPSPVAKYVFEDFNYAEQFKVISGTSKGYNEIWWFYPSLSINDETTSTNAAGQNREINRYVKYNYIENLWDVGTFSRTAWVGGSIFENDLACDANRFIYKHDVGTTDDGSPFNAFVESADFDIDDGQNIMLVDKALPDAISTDKQGGTYDETYKITFSSRKDSIGDYINKGPFTVRNRDVTIDGVNYIKTGRINPRVRGRQMKIKVESDGLHDHWRLGDLRLDMKPDGER